MEGWNGSSLLSRLLPTGAPRPATAGGTEANVGLMEAGKSVGGTFTLSAVASEGLLWLDDPGSLHVGCSELIEGVRGATAPVRLKGSACDPHVGAVEAKPLNGIDAKLVGARMGVLRRMASMKAWSSMSLILAAWRGSGAWGCGGC